MTPDSELLITNYAHSHHPSSGAAALWSTVFCHHPPPPLCPPFPQHFLPHCAARKDRSRQALDTSTCPGKAGTCPVAWLISWLPEPRRATFLAPWRRRVGRTLVRSAFPVGRDHYPMLELGMCLIAGEQGQGEAERINTL